MVCSAACQASGYVKFPRAAVLPGNIATPDIQFFAKSLDFQPLIVDTLFAGSAEGLPRWPRGIYLLFLCADFARPGTALVRVGHKYSSQSLEHLPVSVAFALPDAFFH